MSVSSITDTGEVLSRFITAPVSIFRFLPRGASRNEGIGSRRGEAMSGAGQDGCWGWACRSVVAFVRRSLSRFA